MWGEACSPIRDGEETDSTKDAEKEINFKECGSAR